MAASFPGFPKAGLDFLADLKQNNTRDWFQPRKEIFEAHVKAPMVALVDAFNSHLVKFAPDYVNEPAKAVYRIYRDTRFSNDKTPYKTHIASVFPRQGLAKHAGAGFYFGVSPEEIEFAGGLYMPGPDELRAVRTHILDSHAAFEKIIRNKTLKTLLGEMRNQMLSRVPKGFPAGHPAADHLKAKQWIYYQTDIATDLALTKDLLPELLKRAKALTPFLDFLNAPLRGLATAAAKSRDFLE